MVAGVYSATYAAANLSDVAAERSAADASKEGPGRCAHHVTERIGRFRYIVSRAKR
jgi:hypothetical protein